jgi:hypothetical protein
MPSPVENQYLDWWTSNNEQSLLQSLTTESIKYHSLGVIYLPRSLHREDTLYNEDILSQFTTSYEVPIRIENVNGWGGTGDFMSKFGITTNDTLNVEIAKDTWPTYTAGSGLTRPMEGDWIYLPQPMNALFEITFVKHEKADGEFYPLGGLYFYEVSLQLHKYNQEAVNTGNSTLDIFETDQAYSQNLVFSSGSGTFTVGETVFEGSSISAATGTGVVGSWSANTNTLVITYITGEFSNTGIVKGATSNASYILAETPNIVTMPNDRNNDNQYLTDEAATLIVDES